MKNIEMISLEKEDKEESILCKLGLAGQMDWLFTILNYMEISSSFLIAHDLSFIQNIQFQY